MEFNRNASPSFQLLAQQLNLLQVLFMLPTDVLRESFMSNLLRTDKQNLRSVSKEACRLMGQLAQRLVLHLTPSTNTIHKGKWISKFSAVTELNVTCDQEAAKDEVLVYLLHSNSRSLQHVKVLSLRYQGNLTYSLTFAVSKVLPSLEQLEVLECESVSNLPLFSSTASLRTLGWFNKKHTGRSILVAPSAVASIFELPALENLKLAHLPWSQLRPNSSIKYLRVAHDVTEEGVQALEQLTNLESLECNGLQLTSSASGKFAALKSLRLHSATTPKQLLNFIQQPTLNTIKAKCLLIAPPLAGASHGEWAADIKEAVMLMQQLGPCDHFPTLEFRHLDAQDLLSAARELPVLLNCHSIHMVNTSVTSGAIQQVCAKVPALEIIGLTACSFPDKQALGCVSQLQSLNNLKLTAPTGVTLAGISALAGAFGKQAVRIQVNAALAQGQQLEDINNLLHSSGAASTLALL